MTPEESSHSELASGRDQLLAVATPRLYRDNAFRVLGLGVDASTREVRKRQRSLAHGARVGIGGDTSTGPLPLEEPPDEEAMRAALQRIVDPAARLIDELFWFWPDGEDGGLAALSAGQIDKARSAWEGRGWDPEARAVALHNLAVLRHVQVLDAELANEDAPKNGWSESYAAWSELSEDEMFWSRIADRIRELDDPRLTTGLARRLRETLPEALVRVQAVFALEAAESEHAEDAERHIASMRGSGFDAAIVDGSLRDALRTRRERVKLACAALEKETDEDAKVGTAAVDRLFESVRQPFRVLDGLLAVEDPVRQGAHDEVAACVLRAQIAYCKDTEEWDVGLAMLERAKEHAASPSMRERIDENIGIVTKNHESGLCFFCGAAPLDEVSSNSHKLYGNVQRIPLGLGQVRVTWKKAEIRVPRCKSCEQAHTEESNFGCGFVFLGMLAGIAALLWIDFYEEMSFEIPINIGWVVVCAITGWVFGDWLDGLSRPEGIKPSGDETNYRPLKELIDQGWQYGTEPPDEA